MSVIRLTTKRVEKPWGRHDLWPGFADAPADADPVGEIWFEMPAGAREGDPELLIKYLFTSEKLSIQVHPGDEDAQQRGYPRGKSEAWQILSAEPHATIAIGTLTPMTRDELRAAAEDGSIEAKVDWKSVHADQFWYSPAGTVHAIGPGLVLVEVQQNVDLTYRLYDYGRPRELHLEDGVGVSDPVPYVAPFSPRDLGPGRRLLAAEGAFVTERWTTPHSGTIDAEPGRPVWLVPLAGGGTVGEERFSAGGVWYVDNPAAIATDEGCDLLLAYPGGEVNPRFLA